MKKGIVIMLLIMLGLSAQSQASLIMSKWTPAAEDSASVVELKYPLMYENIQRYVYSLVKDLEEKQCRAWLEFKVLTDDPQTDTAKLGHLFRTFTKTVFKEEVHDFVTIVDTYKYQIKFTK